MCKIKIKKKLSLGLAILVLIEFIQVNVAFANPSGLMNSPWPMIHGDSRLTGQSPYDTSKIGGAIKWRFETDDQIETSPVIAGDGTIYITDQACNLYAVNPEGKEKWRFNTGDPIHSIEWGSHSCFQSSPSVGFDGTIYIAPMSDYMHAITPEGKEKWKYPVFNFKNNWSSPAIGSDGTIYVGSEAYPPSESGKPQEKPAFIYAINPDGSLKWSYDTGGNWATSTGSIAKDGTIYMSGNECHLGYNCENTLFAFNGQTGEVKWRFFHGGVMESSASLGNDGTIYFGVKGKNNPKEGAKFFAITPEGKEKWSFDAPCGNSIIPGIANDGTIYWGDWDGGFYAISPEGKIKWKIETPKTFETLSSSPAIGKDGTIYFGSLANHFYAYTPEGKEKWRYYFANGGINSSPAIGADGTVYVGFIPGELIAFGTGSPTSFDGNNQSSATTQNKVLFVVIGILLIGATIFLVVYFTKRQMGWKWRALLLLPITATIIFLSAAFQNNFGSNDTVRENDINTMEEMYETGEDFERICPENITLNYDKYTAHLQNRDWEIKNMRQIDWISEQCPNTKWPNGKQ